MNDDKIALQKDAAVLYGKFILTAYAMYNADPKNLCPSLPPKTDPSAMPDGWDMVAWIHMSDFAFSGGRERKFYGFVARNNANPYSHVIAIRGTEGAIEWYDDAVCVPKAFTPVPKAGNVSAGFDDIYMTMQVVSVRARGGMKAMLTPETLSTRTFADQIEDLLETTPVERPMALAAGGAEPEHGFVVTGHSLGGALCTLYTMEHAVKKKADATRKVTINRVCTFASPRVGMEAFVSAFDGLPIDSWRIANAQDIVPKVPPSIALILPYQHVDTLYTFSSAGTVKFNPACWHSMYTYLNWLDPQGQPIEKGCKVS